MSNSINVLKMIDDSKFNRFHASLLFWCGLIIVFDGFDLVIYGSVLPMLMEEWSLNAKQAGTLGSVALLGMMIGALIFGPLADKLGRKMVVLLCVALFSLFTGLNGLSSGPVEFGIYRFIAGLGLGGVMPNTVALITEYSPRSLKSTLVSIMFSGYAIGGVMAAGLAILMLGQFGWRSVFFVGALPLLLLPFMFRSLPESPKFLLMKNDSKKIGTVLTKVNPSFKYNNQSFKSPKNEETGVPVLNLFKNGRALSTIMFWVCFFMCLLMIYGLNTWLPKLMVGAGININSGLLFLLVLNFGAIFGAVGGGWLADKWDVKSVLILFFIMASVSLTLLGLIKHMALLYLLVAIAGASTIGTQIIANAYISQYYPSEMRSSGIGWGLGIGRLGAIAGPMIGGFLLSMNLPFYQNFLAFAIPGIIAVIALLLIQNKYSASKEADRYLKQEA